MIATIGLPVYNGDLFIESCIQSILNQTFSDFELLITDDGSTDRTEEIVLSFKDERIKWFSDGLNKGISYRLNQQIAMAKGKFFIRMDADDIMFSDRLEKQISFLNNHNVDVIGSNAVVIDDKNKILGFRECSLPSSFKDVYKKVLFIHPTVAGKTEWFRTYKYREGLAGVEDFDLWIRSCFYSSFHIISEPLLFYRDPLIFSFKKYAYRQKQLRKCLIKNFTMSNFLLLVYVFILSYFKQLVLFSAFLTKANTLLVSKRNQSLKKQEKDAFDKILHNIID
ncbi:glycosyltransferase [Bacteroidaceae bacterium HV4-6-C5C]|nr:glycosyltransferase [Bacteroidaceae bacterium HV4-6-C5C]